MKVDSWAATIVDGNYVANSQPGCYIAHHDADWIIEASDFDLEDYGLEPDDEDSVSDMLLDPVTKSLSAINTSHDADKSYFITTKHRALNGLGQRMTPGPTRNGDGEEDLVVTLILVVKPRSVIEACYLDVTDGQAKGEEPLDLFSDIKAVKPHPDPSEWDPSRSYPFPLAGDSAHLCSQGVGGLFTHFYSGTLHALDFECPEGTPVLALTTGTVKEVRQSNTSASGIHARGLFDWNSVTVLQDDGLLAEYVHIRADSAVVKSGERVVAGQPLCKSGGAGFCPSPHLHLQLQVGEGDNAPTVLFALLDGEGQPYFPVAGKWYGPEGERAGPLMVDGTRASGRDVESAEDKYAEAMGQPLPQGEDATGHEYEQQCNGSRNESLKGRWDQGNEEFGSEDAASEASEIAGGRDSGMAYSCGEGCGRAQELEDPRLVSPAPPRLPSR